MNKIISYAVWMVAAVSIFAWSAPSAAVPEAGMHVSNRVKIERPEILAAPDADVVKEEAVVARPKPRGPGAVEAVKPAEPAKSVEPAEDVAATLDVKDPVASQLPGRFYSRKGRMDPFEPFLYRPEKEVTATEKDQLQIRAPQTPLERMNLAQLRLTAVIRAPGKIRALVQERSGKGYVIGEGTYIGDKGGLVTKILSDRVIVEEKYLDIYGKIAVREKELKLQN